MMGLNLNQSVPTLCGCLNYLACPTFYEIHRAKKGDLNSYYHIYTSSIKDGDKVPEWEPHTINMGLLCSNDYQLPFMFFVFIKVNDEEIEIGRTKTCVEDMIKGRTMDLGKGQQLSIEKFNILTMPQITDYLRSGWQISFSIAIDFTGSNKSIEHEGSLHSIA